MQSWPVTFSQVTPSTYCCRLLVSALLWICRNCRRWWLIKRIKCISSAPNPFVTKHVWDSKRYVYMKHYNNTQTTLIMHYIPHSVPSSFPYSHTWWRNWSLAFPHKLRPPRLAEWTANPKSLDLKPDNSAHLDNRSKKHNVCWPVTFSQNTPPT